MFLFRLLFSPVRIVLIIARIMGYNRFVVFVLGVAVGLLIAPTTGAELRERIRAEVEARRAAGPVTPVGSTATTAAPPGGATGAAGGPTGPHPLPA